MKAKQLYIVLIVSSVLAVAGFFGIGYGANTLMQSQANKLSKLRADSAALSDQEVALAKNKQDIAKYGDLNKIAQSIVPQDKDQAEAVREIVNLAAQSGIGKLSSITFPNSTLGAVSGGATVKGTGSSNPNLTQLLPVTGINGVYTLKITVTQLQSDQVPYSQFTTFLTKLEQNRRTAQVSNITIQPDGSNPNMVAFVLIINEYIKP
ncbi:MAG TPA: hypothetical protein VLF40_04130 [Candidatus Saccharimonadales bacterium]|nr:hypothetical protein [Candidatus Saccharimonadales bacterium]